MLLLRFHIFLILGDSLVRQLYTMLVLMLTNGFNEGSFRKALTKEDRKFCRGEHQITSRLCSLNIVAKKLTQSNNSSSICNGYGNIDVDYLIDYKQKFADEFNKKIDSLSSKENSWIICSVGLHFHLDFDKLKEIFLDRLWEKLQRSGKKWPKLIWVGLHGLAGFLKLSQIPHKGKLKGFNSKVTDYWTKRNVTIIDTYPLSEGIKSYDGVHYGLGLNHLKMHIILDTIKQYYDHHSKNINKNQINK